MEDSILVSTKKLLGLPKEYTPFDFDVITYINAAFSILDQMGVGPTGGFSIEDEDAVWADYAVPSDQLSLIKAYFFLRVKLMFDAPTTSYHLTAMNEQLAMFEWRLNHAREEALLAEEVP